jgi:hypothetical protein
MFKSFSPRLSAISLFKINQLQNENKSTRINKRQFVVNDLRGKVQLGAQVGLHAVLLRDKTCDFGAVLLQVSFRVANLLFQVQFLLVQFVYLGLSEIFRI